MKKYLPYTIILLILLITSISSIIFFTVKTRIIYEYSDIYNGYLVSDVRGISSTITIPKEYDGKNIVGIKQRAFYKNDKIEKVLFEDKSNIIIIEKLAFSECSKLKEIDLSNVKYIERNAFSYASNLEEVSLDNLIELGASAFFDCSNLKKLNSMNLIENIGSYAFYNTKIEELSFPNTLRVISYDSFLNMNKLKKISLYYNNLKDGNSYIDSLNGIEIIKLS